MKRIVLLLMICALIPIAVTAQSTGNWAVRNDVDEFGTPTGKKFIYARIADGKFSNSATRESILTGRIEIQSDGSMVFGLYEYGKYRCDTSVTLKVKNSNNEIITIDHFHPRCRYTKIHSPEETYYPILEQLLLEGKVMFHGARSGGYTLSFSVYAHGLQAALDKAKINIDPPKN